MHTQLDLIINRSSSDAALDTATATQHARNQVLFRDVNEHIAALNDRWSETGIGVFICECSSDGCADSVEITPAEYEGVRTNGARFVVLSGHQSPEVERVVGGNGRFLVVEKIGAAAAIARTSDPRRHE